MAITPLPSPPSRSDPPLIYIAKADAWNAAFPQFQVESNAQAAALTQNATNDTSASSVLIGVGAKSFTVSAGKSYQPGMFLIIADTAAPATNWMLGQVTSYAGTALAMNITQIGGSGTKTAWVISQSVAGGAIAGLQNLSAGANIASAATVDLTTATGNTVDITGTVTTTAITINAGQQMMLIAQAAWPLTHHATNLSLPGGANYTCSAGDRIFCVKDVAGIIYVTPWKADGTAVVAVSQIESIAVSVAANALTSTLKAGSSIKVRSATLSSGIVTQSNLAADASLVVPNGATLGAFAAITSASATMAGTTTLTINTGPTAPIQVGAIIFQGGTRIGKVASIGTYLGGTGTGTVILDASATFTAVAIVIINPSRFIMLAMGNNEVALVNQAGGVKLDETGLISTTAISAGATANNVIYSTTARTNQPYQVVGFMDIANPTVGAYSVAPELVYAANATSLAAMWSIGNGQVWSGTLHATERITGLTYTNIQGRPIEVSVQTASTLSSAIQIQANGAVIAASGSADATSGSSIGLTAIIPAGATYVVAFAGVAALWCELK